MDSLVQTTRKQIGMDPAVLEGIAAKAEDRTSRGGDQGVEQELDHRPRAENRNKLYVTLQRWQPKEQIEIKAASGEVYSG